MNLKNTWEKKKSLMHLFTFLRFCASLCPLCPPLLGCILVTSWLHLRGKKLFMCLFAFLCFFMPFMPLLGCIFLPFVSFMRVKSFCKKKGLKRSWWPHLHYYYIYAITSIIFFNLNIFQLLQSFLSQYFYGNLWHYLHENKLKYEFII